LQSGMVPKKQRRLIPIKQLARPATLITNKTLDFVAVLLCEPSPTKISISYLAQPPS
jgi:hypothetical protein